MEINFGLKLKRKYFVKCLVTGGLQSNEGTYLVYFTVKSTPDLIEKQVKIDLNREAMDLVEIMLVTKV
ncbi:MAG: hypothetical protein GY861_05455 [bacterium]|nr:hypothetical protein [bacterium]